MNTGNSGPKSTETSNGRSWIVEEMPASCVATHHSATEIATVNSSLVRARRPSERRLTIFV